MAKKKAAVDASSDVSPTNSSLGRPSGRSPSPPSDDSEKPLSPLAVKVPDEERFPVKVNNASLSEMKIACDDALKRFLSRPELFKPIHQHTDVKLVLGYATVIIAAVTGGYSYKVDFETSKVAVWIGMILYIWLSIILTSYVYLVEGNTVFMGRRKTFSKRIVTERVTVDSVAIPPTTTNFLSPLTALFDFPSPNTSASPPSPPTAESASTPEYQLTVTYIRTSNANKSLLKRGKVVSRGGYFNKWFDDKGVLDQAKFEEWVGVWVEGVMDGKTG